MTRRKTSPVLLSSQPRKPTTAELSQTLAAPAEPLSDLQSTGTIRRAVDDLVPIDWTPARVITVLKNAASLTNAPEFARLAASVERRNAKLRSVLSIRKLAVAGLPIVVEPGGTKLKDRKAAEAVQELLASEAVETAIFHLLDGIYTGYAAAELVWDTTGPLWTIDHIEPVPAAWLSFDKATGRVPLLAPRENGGAWTPLAPSKFIYHAPQLLSGLPVTSGLAYTAAFYSALTSLTLADWTQFVELYGQPLRLGKFPKGDSAAHKKDRDVLKRALQNLGADAWAMIPQEMQIEFVEAATRNASAEVYERLARYLDELLAVLVLGGSLTSGTGNTGSGGSQALGVVHNEVRADLLRADARALAATLRRDLVTPFVRFNFGEDCAIPKVRFHIEEAEDVAALADAVAKLVPLGLQVSQDELRERLGLRAPKAGEDTLNGTTGQAAPAQAAAPTQANRAVPQNAFSGAEQDELDVLIAEYQADPDYLAADAALDAQLLSAIEGASTPEQLVAALVAVVQGADVEAMRGVLTAALTSAKAAGNFGVNIGGK